LPDLISKEPLGPAVRQGDWQWLSIVAWTHFAMVDAEELDVSSKTIDAAMKSNKPDVKRLVGSEGDYGQRMGLTSDWAARIVRLVGNYSEVYERNIGVKSQLGIPRGINERWTAGGIMYAPPISIVFERASCGISSPPTNTWLAASAPVTNLLVLWGACHLMRLRPKAALSERIC
jgi:general L-amino acid transport system substrate-binding protein